MAIECSISNFTFLFNRIDDKFKNNIVSGKYQFELNTNPVKVLLSDYTLKGTRRVLEDIMKLNNHKKIYVIGITYMDKENNQPIDTQIGITGKLKIGENHYEGADRETVEEFGGCINTSTPISISDSGRIKIYGFNANQCEPLQNVDFITSRLKHADKQDDKSRRVGIIIAGELKDLINIIMNIRFRLYIEKDIYGIKLLSLDDILKIPETQLAIN
jgi:hypothetical protein